MSIGSDQFIQAEESAEKLVTTLQNLQREVNSYHSAGDELTLVRERLSKFIEATEAIVKDTHEAVKALKEMGGPKIHAKLEGISLQVETEVGRNARSVSKLQTLSTIALTISLLSLGGIVILLLR